MSAGRQKIVVLGAGIVGASAAYHLARRGAAVTLVDQGPAAGATTGKALGWINVSHGWPEPYQQLRHLAVRDYHRLEQELQGALRVDWCGALTWACDPAETMRFARAHTACGYAMRLVERDEAATLEPGLVAAPEVVAFAETEGAVDPVVATQALVRAAQHAGADIRLGCGAVTLTANDSKVTGVHTGQGFIEAEVVMLAAGASAVALCVPLGLSLPVAAIPAILLRLQSPGSLVRRVISSPEMEVRQGSGSSLLAAEDYIDDSAMNGPEAVAKRAFATIKAQLRGAAALTLPEVVVGFRPFPEDGLPIIGFSAQVPGLYLAVMHAGVTLAPAIGRLASREILDGADAPELQACRLGRFAQRGAASPR